MDFNEKTITRRTVIILSVSAFVVIGLIFAAVSLTANRYRDSNAESSIIPSQIPEKTVSSYVSGDFPSELSDNSNQIVQDASQTFAEESIYDSSEDESISHGWVINNFGYTYLYGDSGFEQFNFSNTTLNRYAESLNALAECVPENTRLFNITVPVSCTFVSIPREIYIEDNFFNKSQSAFVSTVATKLNEKIINVPIIPAIEEQFNNGDYIFFRTDRNWTSLGAYTAYLEYCENSGIKAYSLASFTEINAGDYLGSFYNATKSEAMKDNPDSLICYSTINSVKTSLTVYDSGIVYTDYILCGNNISTSNAYDIFLGTTAGRYEINTTADGGSLLIIGDSSSYPIVPFLASHYSKIDIVNPQYFDVSINEFLIDHKYDDIITMCYSTNAISGDYIPSFNTLTGVNETDE